MKRHTQKEELDREVKKLNNQLKNDKAKFDTFSNPVLTGNDAKRFREMFLNDGKSDTEKAKRNDIPKTDKYKIEYSNREVKILFKVSDITSFDMKNILSSVPDDFIMDASDVNFDVLVFYKEKSTGT